MSKAMTTQQTAGAQMLAQVTAINIKDVLPEHISEEKFRRVAMTAINLTPALYKCDRKSLLGALLNAATDGLLPDGREAALVLFGKDAVYMPMIAGVYKKIRNSGKISTLSSHVVYEADEFDYWIDENGPHMRHTPFLTDNRGKPKAVYAICKLKDESVEIEVMTVDQVEQVRAVSRSKSGPWVDWWDEMARKTVVRRLSKRLPMSSDQEDVLRRDDVMYDLEDKTERDKPPRPQQADYQPSEGEDFDARHRETIRDDQTESANGGSSPATDAEQDHGTTKGTPATPSDGSTPAPASEAVDSSGLTFVEDGMVYIFDNEGEAVNSYQRAGNYFKAIKTLLAKVDDPRGLLELNQPGAQHFISADEGLMEMWESCWQLANDAEK